MQSRSFDIAPQVRRLIPALNWITLAVLLGVVLGLGDAVLVGNENAYFRDPLRSLGGRVLQSGALDGARLGALVAIAGLIVFLFAWPVCRLVWRDWRSASIGAALAVPVLALLLAAAYKLNIDVFPSLLSITSILGNLALLIGTTFLWWYITRRLVRREVRLPDILANGKASAVCCAALLVLLGLTSVLVRLWKVEAPKDSPNVLIVLIDALRADRLGAYGYHRDTSPRIDRLAREGWKFDAAISQAPWTKPSITALITGLYPRQTSVSSGTWAQEGDEGAVLVQTLAAEHLTLAEYLASLGYETGAFGENHHLVPELGFAQGYFTYDWYEPPRAGALGKLARRMRPEFAAGWINANFIDWVDDSSESRPFFAYLHHIDVHWPYKSPPPFAGMFMKSPPSEDFNSSKFVRKTIAGIRGESDFSPSPETLHAMSDAYDEGIRHVDNEIGRLFDELARRGLYDNTLIIVTADHGEEFMDHGLLGHGITLFDETIRVPLIVKYPCPGPHCGAKTISTQVELVDAFPSIVSALGRESPPHLAGRDFAAPADATRAAFSESDRAISLRTPEWKWIYSKESDSGSLYNLRQDPREMHDVANRESAVSRDLTARLLDFTVIRARSASVDSKAIEADERMLENLKALGYVK